MVVRKETHIWNTMQELQKEMTLDCADRKNKVGRCAQSTVLLCVCRGGQLSEVVQDVLNAVVPARTHARR